ncbi:unnamed protein product, partial [Polarella glacialis]
PEWPVGSIEGAITGGAASMYRLGWLALNPHRWDHAAAALSAFTFVVVVHGKDPLLRLFKLPGMEVLLATLVGALLAMAGGYTGSIVGAPPVPVASASAAEAGGLLQMLTSWVIHWPWELPFQQLASWMGGWHWAFLSSITFAAVDFLAIISVEAERPPPGGWSPGRELGGQGVACLAS